MTRTLFIVMPMHMMDTLWRIKTATHMMDGAGLVCHVLLQQSVIEQWFNVPCNIVCRLRTILSVPVISNTTILKASDTDTQYRLRYWQWSDIADCHSVHGRRRHTYCTVNWGVGHFPSQTFPLITTTWCERKLANPIPNRNSNRNHKVLLLANFFVCLTHWPLSSCY